MSYSKEGYHLVWCDDFNYQGAPNPLKWNYDLGNHQWANRELQAYTDRPANVSVENGKLFIRAIKERDGERDYTSARLITHDRQSWQYGLFEFRVKLPTGRGSWPAVWMLPDSIKAGNPWPRCGEIDIIEHCGRWPNKLIFSLHSETHNHTRHDTQQCTKSLEYPGVMEGFHDYAMEWTQSYIEFYVDKKSVCRFDKAEYADGQTEAAWPFDQPFFLILNIAAGGTMGGEVDDRELPFIMEVEHVRVYQKD